MSVDLETGIDEEQAFKAVERTRPIIQAMLHESSSGDVVAGVLLEAFFGCLKAAGLSGWEYEKNSKALSSKLGVKTAGIAVQRAYEPLGAEITNMMEEGIDPLAIAYSLNGAVLNITSQMLGKSNSVSDAINDAMLLMITKAMNTRVGA
jgi:hypothetical protein